MYPTPAKARREMEQSEREYHKGHLEASIEHLTKAIGIAPDYMEAHNNLGSRYLALGDYARAVEPLETAVRLEPSSIRPRLNLTLAFYVLQRIDQAEQSAREALRLAGDLPKGHYLLGLTLIARGRTKEAVAHLQKSTAEFPRAHLLAAQLLAQDGSVEAAASELKAYLAIPHPPDRAQVETWLTSLR